jgi:hypothetical protein
MAEVKPLKLASGIITELGSSDTIPVSAIPLSSLGVVRVLTTTVRNCSNTASEVSVIEATIPANGLADGHYLELRGRIEWRNLDGGSPTITTRVKAGSSYLTLGSATIGGSGYTHIPYRVLMVRHGSSLWVTGWDYAYGMAAEWHPAALNEVIGADLYASGKKGGEIASLDFTSDLTIALTAQWSAASANRYYNALDGEVLLR